MSQALPQANNVPNAGTGGHHYPPQMAQNQASAPGVSHFIDGSGPIFSMYLGMAEEEDKKMAENWKADADGILIFTGLFSAAVASLISVSIQDIQQNPQDTSNFYLANIYQTIADPNRPNISTPSSPPPFTPPTFAVWVNGLWFLSLVISITCALLATLLQQWARRYLKATQPRYSLHKRARIRSFFAEGVEKSFLPLAVEALPTLLHLSLFLFFSGLVIFLRNVDLTIFKAVLSWVGISSALYGCVSLIPIFRRDSPYYTPLTGLVRAIVIVTLKLFFHLRLCFRCLHFAFSSCAVTPSHCFYFCGHTLCRTHALGLGYHRGNLLEQVLEMTLLTPEEAALKAPPSIDTRAFMWTLDSLDEDHELERFFSSLPDFRSSKVVDDPLLSLTEVDKEKIFLTLSRFLDFTFSSDLLPEAVKSQRAIMCAKALDLAEFSPESGDALRDTLFKANHRGPRTTNFDPIVDDNRTERTALAQAIITGMVTRPQQRDDSWFRQVAPNALDVPETVLRDYAANGDSLSLAILIYATRQQFTYSRYSTWPNYKIQNILMEGSDFNARDTSPELQHEFCKLWNQIVLKARKDDDQIIVGRILNPIRNIYVELHRDIDSGPTQFFASISNWDDILKLPSIYPVCKVPGHVHGNPASTSSARPVRHNTTAAIPSPASPDLPSSSIPVPPQVIEGPKDATSLDNFQPDQTTMEGLRSSLTFVDLATTSGIRDFDTDITTPHPTPETSTSAPLSSGSPPGAVSLQRNADQLTPSGPPNLPSIASFNPFRKNLLPTGSHHSIIVSTAPSASPGMTIAPNLDAPASTAPDLRMEKDTFDCPSANRANTTVALDLPVRIPLPVSTINSDVAIAGPSPRESTIGRTGDQPPGPSDFRYDIV